MFPKTHSSKAISVSLLLSRTNQRLHMRVENFLQFRYHRPIHCQFRSLTSTWFCYLWLIPKPSFLVFQQTTSLINLVRAFSPIANNIHFRQHPRPQRQTFPMTKQSMSSVEKTNSKSNEDNQSSNNNNNDNNNTTTNSTLRVALCQFMVTEDKSRNLRTCASYLDQAASQQAQLVILPEIWNSPYAVSAFGQYAEDITKSSNCSNTTPKFHAAPSIQLLYEKAREHNLWIVGGSIPEIDSSNNNNNKLYNTCIVMDPTGTVVAKHRKMHLFDIDVPNGIRFQESETLSAGTTATYFDTPLWGKIGIGICYDIRFPEYAQLLQQMGCTILIYPGAFNLITGPAHWELLQRARAVDQQCFVVTASPARTTTTTTTTTPRPITDDRTEYEEPSSSPSSSSPNQYPPYSAWGHSSVISPWGNILATTDEKPSFVVADLDLNEVQRVRRAIPVLQQKRTDLYTLVQPKKSIS